MSVAIIRHGKAKYELLRVDNLPSTFFDAQSFLDATADIKDLDEASLTELDMSIQNRIDQTPGLKDKKVVIRVSPFGRTIQTANHVVYGLQKNGIPIKDLSIVEHIKEVEGFSWQVFDALVRGGTLDMGGKQIQLNHVFTNPENLSHSDYFIAGAYKNISRPYLEKIGLAPIVDSMETYTDVTNRSKILLSRVFKAIDNDTVLCIVTHQAFSDRITHEKVGKYEGQKPGEVFYLTDGQFTDGTIKRIS